jgi:hypothetical protein
LAIRGIRQKRNLVVGGGWVLKKTQSLTESVGVVSHSEVSTTGWMKIPALFYFMFFLFAIFVLSRISFSFALHKKDRYGKIRVTLKIRQL